MSQHEPVPVPDAECVPFLEWALPRLGLRWPGFRKVRRQVRKRLRSRIIELGHRDLVASDEWIAFEYATVRRLYADLGIPERTEIEFFDDGHVIHGKATFRFLHKHRLAGTGVTLANGGLAAAILKRKE